MTGETRIPAFVNAAAGSADQAEAALEATGGFDVHRVAPDEISARVREARERGVQRVLVAGGDGTIASAAKELVGTTTALVPMPGGTLNHFARDHGIPLDATVVAAQAATAPVRLVDVGWLDDRLFLNTSSVGAYVLFVRTRERIEKRFGYRLASALAAFRLLGRVRPFRVEMEANGKTLRTRSALVFVGVGERELRVPALGARTNDGRRALHVMVAHGGTAARLAAVGVQAMLRGVREVARGPYFDAMLTDRLRIELPRRGGNVAIDGELVRIEGALEYRIQRDALRIVVPETPAS